MAFKKSVIRPMKILAMKTLALLGKELLCIYIGSKETREKRMAAAGTLTLRNASATNIIRLVRVMLGKWGGIDHKTSALERSVLFEVRAQGTRYPEINVLRAAAVTLQL